MQVNLETTHRHRLASPNPATAKAARYVSRRPALLRSLEVAAREMRAPLAKLALLDELMEADALACKMGPASAQLFDPKVLGQHIQDVLERLRNTGHPFALKPGITDLSVIVRHALSALRPVAESRRLAIAIDALAPLVVNGDTRLLPMAAGDLFEVVLRHAPDGAALTCTIGLRSDQAVISLTCDSGAGASERPIIEAELHPLRWPTKPLPRLEPWLARHVIEHHCGRVKPLTTADGFGLAIELPAQLM